MLSKQGFRAEAVGKEFPQGNGNKAAIPPGNQDFHVGVEFKKHLAAGAARPAVIFTVACDGDALHVVDMAFADCLCQCGAFGADGGAVGGVFHVASGEY